MPRKHDQNINTKLFAQVAEWEKAKDWKSIIDAFGNQNPLSLNVAIIVSLANAYVNEGYETTDRALYRKAVELLAPLAPDLKNEWQFNHIMGVAFFHLDLYGYALDFMTQALRLMPASKKNFKEDFEKVRADCERYLSLPYFEDSFKKRVKKLWQQFGENEADFRKRLDIPHNDEESQELHIRFKEILSITSNNIFCFMGKTDGKYQLLLTPFGKLMPFYQIEYIKKNAPPAILDNWEIKVGLPKGFYNQIPEYPDADTVLMLKLKSHRDEIYQFIPFSEDFPAYILNTPLFSLPMVDEFVINAIGETAYSKFISLPQPVKSYGPESLDYFDGIVFPLANLSKFLDHFGIEVDASSEYLLDRYVQYRRSPKKDKNQEEFRSDVISGRTRCKKFIKDYYLGKEEAVNELESDGIIAGYFCYRKEGFTDKESKKQALQFNEDFRHQLLRMAGEENVKIIGYAYGRYFDYVDVLIFDLPKVIDAAKEIFDRSVVPFGGFRVFRKGAGTALISGDIFWKINKSANDPAGRVYVVEKDEDGRYIFYPLGNK